MSYTRFSDEEIYRANTVDLPLFLIQRGETLEKTGSIYKFIYKDSSGTHDSITMKDNHWYDHKNQRGGYPVKFMQEYFGISYRDAVKELLGGHVSSAGFAAPKPAEQVEIKKEFKLPEPNSDMRRVFAYLTKQRFISSKILSAFAHEHTIYEEKAHHNVVFVGLGENGVPRQAHQRSTTSFGNTFRMTVAGSDTRYSFAHFGSSRRLFVFEAPIDMLSFITLYPNNWENQSFLAMNGVYESAVLKALETHDNLTDIYLCTDNDIGGIEAADRLRDILTDKGYTNILRITPTNKDFNEDLKSMNGIEPLPAVPHRRKEIVSECISELKFEPFDITRCGTTLTALVNNKKYFAAADIAMRTAAIIVMRDISGLVYDSFDFQPFNFIPKGSTDVLISKLNNVIFKLIENIGNDRPICFELPYGEKKYVEPSKIISISSKSNYLDIVCEKETIHMRGKINNILKVLPQKSFVRIHNRHIINMAHFCKIKNSASKILLDNSVEIIYVYSRHTRMSVYT